MQNELINRRAMIESITNHMNKPENEDVKEVYESFIKFLNEQPIAYDVDAVVEQLENNSIPIYDEDNETDIRIIGKNEAFDIVRAGGKE